MSYNHNALSSIVSITVKSTIVKKTTRCQRSVLTHDRFPFVRSPGSATFLVDLRRSPSCTRARTTTGRTAWTTCTPSPCWPCSPSSSAAASSSGTPSSAGAPRCSRPPWWRTRSPSAGWTGPTTSPWNTAFPETTATEKRNSCRTTSGSRWCCCSWLFCSNSRPSFGVC